MEKEARNLFGMGQTALGNANRRLLIVDPLWVVLFVLGEFSFDGCVTKTILSANANNRQARRSTMLKVREQSGKNLILKRRKCANDESVKSQRNTALFRCTYGAYPSGLESNNPKAIASGPSRCYSKGRSGLCPKRKSKGARTRGAIVWQRRAVSIVVPTARGRLITHPSRAIVGI
jgi:hypothetical protein